MGSRSTRHAAWPPIRFWSGSAARTYPTWRRAVTRCTGTATTVGLVAGAIILAAAALLSGTARLAFLALGLTLPGLLLQDSWRYSFFALGRGSQAFLNDTVWTLALMPALCCCGRPATRTCSGSSSPGVPRHRAAAIGRCRPASLPGCRRRGNGCRATVTSGRATWRREPPTALRPSCATTASASSLGLAAVGYVQAATTLMGPFMVIFFGMGLVTLPEAARILRRSPRHLPLFCLLVSAGLAILALAWGVVLLVALPRGLGHLMLGNLWKPTYPLVLPITILVMGGMRQRRRRHGPARPGSRAAKPARHAHRVGAGVVLGIAGRVAGGAVGAMIGVAVASWIGALLFWRQFRMALREHNRTATGAQPEEEHPRGRSS